jgi:hypothetical protein
MDDRQILDEIERIVDREHQLRAEVERGQLDSDIEQAQMKRLETVLDQCWDLLRQRRARRDAHQDEEQAQLRPASQVEGYLQ